MTTTARKIADEEKSVAAIYEDSAIAESYLDKRMKFSWQRLLHVKQVETMNRAIRTCNPSNVLEVAPGPARLSVELQGVKRGTMIENSEEMISIARRRLEQRGLSQVWQVVGGNAFELSSIVPDGEFDFAYTFRFLRHFRTPEREQLYAGLRSKLRSGGHLAFDVVNSVVLQAVEMANPTKPADEIPIYDVAYTPAEFSQEMKKNGFEVVSLTPIVRHFGLQSMLSYKLDDVAPNVVNSLVALIERLPSKSPLEWVALCRKV